MDSSISRLEDWNPNSGESQLFYLVHVDGRYEEEPSDQPQIGRSRKVCTFFVLQKFSRVVIFGV